MNVCRNVALVMSFGFPFVQAVAHEIKEIARYYPTDFGYIRPIESAKVFAYGYENTGLISLATGKQLGQTIASPSLVATKSERIVSCLSGSGEFRNVFVATLSAEPLYTERVPNCGWISPLAIDDSRVVLPLFGNGSSEITGVTLFDTETYLHKSIALGNGNYGYTIFHANTKGFAMLRDRKVLEVYNYEGEKLSERYLSYCNGYPEKNGKHTLLRCTGSASESVFVIDDNFSLHDAGTIFPPPAYDYKHQVVNTADGWYVVFKTREPRNKIVKLNFLGEPRSGHILKDDEIFSQSLAVLGDGNLVSGIIDTTQSTFYGPVKRVQIFSADLKPLRQIAVRWPKDLSGTNFRIAAIDHILVFNDADGVNFYSHAGNLLYRHPLSTLENVKDIKIQSNKVLLELEGRKIIIFAIEDDVIRSSH